jgi:hypothetical protein
VEQDGYFQIKEIAPVAGQEMILFQLLVRQG